jgi:hypothetical protein
MTEYLLSALFVFIWAMGMGMCYGELKRVDWKLRVIYTVYIAIASMAWPAVLTYILVDSIGDIRRKQQYKERNDDN